MYFKDCAKHNETFKGFLQRMALIYTHKPQTKDKIKINELLRKARRITFHSCGY